MNGNKRFHETFSRLEASPNTYDEVMKMTVDKKNLVKHTRRLSAVIIAASLLLTAALAAAASSGLIKNVFGSGLAPLEQETVTNTDENGNVISSWTTPLEERVESDPALAEGYVEQPSASLTVEGWTWTADEMLVDENGIGALTITLSNPDGIDGAMPTDMVNETGTPTAFFICNSNGTLVDTWDFAIEGSRTPVSVQQAVYFTPFEADGNDAGYTFTAIVIHEKDYAKGSMELRQNEKKLSCTPFASDSAVSASVSPVGVTIKAVKTSEEFTELLINRVELIFADGSSYTVEDDDANILNSRCSSTADCGSEVYAWYAFNRLVDVNNVVCVSVDGSFESVPFNIRLVP